MEYMLVLCRADALCGELAHHGTHTIDQQSVFYSTSSTPPAIMFDVEYCTHLCSLPPPPSTSGTAPLRAPLRLRLRLHLCINALNHYLSML